MHKEYSKPVLKKLKELTLEEVNSTHFDTTYKNYIIPYEFFEKTGKQHYRLLSYISTLFNNTTIIDICSYKGLSALALSYNPTNTIISFDIVGKIVNEEIKNKKNIQFHVENIFEESAQYKWETTIKNSPFIFLDIEPHNGTLEFEFYNYLKKINYRGFVIYNDIWYVKEMRNNFWYKIPYEYRYDLSDFGHLSGTGVFTFDNEIQFPKYDNSSWTMVTAYFNLTKCPDASKEIKERHQEYYLNHSYGCLSLPYNMVIYCDTDSLPKIQEIRPDYLSSKTEYIVCDFDDFSFKKNGKYLDKTFKEYRDMIIENRKQKPYLFDERNTASYYLFCVSRYLMLKDVIDKNPFGSTHFSWINFCIERMGHTNLLRLDHALSIKRNRFSTVYMDHIEEDIVKNTSVYFEWGRPSLCSGFFTGNYEYMYKVCDLIENKFLEYLEQGYGHADEQLMCPVYYENPDLFELFYGEYFQMITNYVDIYQSYWGPVEYYAQASHNHGDYKRCMKACESLFRSHFLGKTANNVEVMDYDRFKHLMEIYMDCLEKCK
jgi:hypothetical protein